MGSMNSAFMEVTGLNLATGAIPEYSFISSVGKHVVEPYPTKNTESRTGMHGPAYSGIDLVSKLNNDPPGFNLRSFQCGIGYTNHCHLFI